MSALNHSLPDSQMQNASGYQNANQSHQMLDDNTLDVLGTSNIDDFEFLHGFPGNVMIPGGLNLDSVPGSFKDPFAAVTASIEHRDSTSSIPPMQQNGYSSISGPAAARQRSFSGGSDGTSPMSKRIVAFQGDDAGFGDVFAMNKGGPRDGSEDKKCDKNEQLPAWTELKTKAGKERKRLPLACTACRRKKIRCSGEKPACKNCTKSKVPCVYKVTTKKAAPRTDYMAMIEKRLKRMESRIMNIVPKEGQIVTAAVPRANVKPPLPGMVPLKTSTGKKRSADAAFGPKLENWSKSKIADRHGDTNESRSGNGGGDGNQASKINILRAQEDEESKLLKEGADKLPSLQLQDHLAEVFFASIYGQTYHLLHKPSFMMKLRDQALPPVLVLAVCACAARFSNHAELDTEPAFLRGEAWASAARDIVLKRYDWPNITILTCLLILGFHEFGTCQGGRSWALAGQAIRMAYALQLHKDLDHDPMKWDPDNQGNMPKLSFIDREIRRRTMWACFLMDRFESSGTGRPTFIREEDLEIQLPVKEGMFLLDVSGPTENLRGEITNSIITSGEQPVNAKENMGVAAYVIRSIAMYSHALTHFDRGHYKKDPHPMWHPNSQYFILVRRLEDFQKDMPNDMIYNEKNLLRHGVEGLANQFIFLYVVIQQTTLLLNRFAVSEEPGCPLFQAPNEFITKLRGKTMTAADNIAKLISAGEFYKITAPFIGYCAFSASIVLTSGAFSKIPDLEASCKKNLTITIRYLNKMKKYWGAFHWMAEKLRTQYKTYADSSVDGPGRTSSNASSLQYGDWIDRFPHGVSKSDYEDPAINIKKEKGDDAVLEQKSNLDTVHKFMQDLPSPDQRPNPKTTKAKSKRTQSSRPQKLDRVQTMPNVRTSSPGMQVSTSPSSANNMSQQVPRSSYNQNMMSPTSLCPPAQFPNHHELLMPSQQRLHTASQQLDRQLAFNGFMGIDHSVMNGSNMNINGMHGNGMNINNVNANAMNANNMNRSATPNSNHAGNDGMGMDWTDMSGIGNIYDLLSMDNMDPTSWFSPFNMNPPNLGMDGSMNDDGSGGASYGNGREFDMRGGHQGMVGLGMGLGGDQGNANTRMGGH